MPKPSEIVTAAAALMNDAAQSHYTNVVVLPFLNMSLDELQEIFELNDIPITNETSAAITIPAGVTSIGFDTTPALPSDFIELQRLWESDEGQNSWTPVTNKGSTSHSNIGVSQFSTYSLEGGRITFLSSIDDRDLKLDYIASIFKTPILIKDINVNLPFMNIKTFLEYKTAALVAMFCAENQSRAIALDALAGTALSRALGIPIKGMQSIVTRRRPFRQNFKSRG